MPEVTLKSWENGKVEISKKGLDKCITIYKEEGILLNRNWIIKGEGQTPSPILTQYFVQYVREIEPKEYEKDDSVCILREAIFFKESYSNAIIYTVTSNEMLPLYKIGDYVGGRLCFEQEKIAALAGSDCIVKLEDESIIFRKLLINKYNEINSYDLVVTDPEKKLKDSYSILNTKIRAAAPVIWHRRPDPLQKRDL